jgi:Zn-dependent protease
MFPSFKIGRFFGIPVYLHSTLILLPVWVMYTTADRGHPTMLYMLAGVAALFGCVLLHEFGHALMARWFGVRTRDVTLYPIGGVARLERMAEKPSEEIFVALAGPAVNVVIAALLTPVIMTFTFLSVPTGPDPFCITLDEPPVVWAAKFCLFLWATNIVLVLFNMIPAFPMDGGRVLRAILAVRFGLLRGTEIAVPVGIVVAFLVAFGMMAISALEGSLNPMPLLIATFVSLIGPMELQGLRNRERHRQEALLRRQGPPAPDQLSIPLPVGQEETKGGFTGFTWDREFGVWVKWKDGRRVAVYWNGPE